MDDQLFELKDDPGERRNVAKLHPDVVDMMKARMAAAVANLPAADVPPGGPPFAPATVHLRFSGAGRTRRVAGTLTVGDAKHPASFSVTPVGVAGTTLRGVTPDAGGAAIFAEDFAFTTSPEALVGFDVRVVPPSAPVTWQIYLDDAPWPDGAVFAGPFGLPASASRAGLTTEDGRDEAAAAGPPLVDPTRDLGFFVTRDHAGQTPAAEPTRSSDADRETQRVLEQWGYARPQSQPR
jgi:hypothetical protein